MKILLVANMYPSDADPQNGIFVKNIAEALVASPGVQVVTAVIRSRSRHRFAKVSKYLLFFLETLVKALRVSADVVYVHYPSHSYVPLLLLGPLRSGRLAVHVHGSDVLREARVTRLYFALKRFVSSKALKAADLIIVPSTYYKEVITQAFKVPKERVFVFSSPFDSTTNFVEHPEVVAQRIVQYANLVGRENVIAGTDCGFGTSAGLPRVHPTVMWAKFRALAEGARLASQRLWGR